MLSLPKKVWTRPAEEDLALRHLRRLRRAAILFTGGEADIFYDAAFWVKIWLELAGREVSAAYA